MGLFFVYMICLVGIVLADGTGTSTLEIPPDDDPDVIYEVQELRKYLNLQYFAQDLDNVATFIRIARTAIDEAGPEHQDLQNRIQTLSFDVSKGCDITVLTVEDFIKRTTTIIKNLVEAYELLLSDYPDMAILRYADIGYLSERMANVSNDVREEFDALEKKVMEVLQTIQNRMASECTQTTDIIATMAKDQEEVKRLEELAKQHDELQGKYEVAKQEAELKGNKAINSYFYYLKLSVNALFTFFGRQTPFSKDKTTELQEARYWREISIEKTKNENEQRKLKYDVNQGMIQLAHKIEKAESKEEQASRVIDSLKGVSKSMRHLIIFLRHAFMFWSRVEKYFHELQEGKAHELMLRSDEEKWRFYQQSDMFKRKARSTLCRWKAFKIICSEHLDKIQQTQSHLHDLILQNPKSAESSTSLILLIEDFISNLQVTQREIKMEIENAKKEIIRLKSELERLKSEL